MAGSAEESAVRNYLVALKDPSSLRDDEKIQDLQRRLAESEDKVERLRLRQQIMDASTPKTERYEDEFITHAKTWADDMGISAAAFVEEGVPPAVLRRAGFPVSVRGRPGRRTGARPTRIRGRVTVEEVRSAIPRSAFTIKQLQERSGASPAVVRKVVDEEVREGRLSREGSDPAHSGPGRAPTLFRRVS